MTAKKTASEVLADLVDAVSGADPERRAAVIAEARAYVDAAGSDEAAREVVTVPVVVVAAMLGTLATIEDATRRAVESSEKVTAALAQLDAAIAERNAREAAALASIAPAGAVTIAPAVTAAGFVPAGPHGGLWTAPPPRAAIAPTVAVAVPAVAPPPLPAAAVADVAAAVAGEGRRLEALAEVIVGYGPWAAGQLVRAGIALPARSHVLTVRPEDGSPLVIESLDVDGVAHVAGAEVAAGSYVAATFRVAAGVPQRGYAYKGHVVGVRLDVPPSARPDPEAEARLAEHAAKVAAMRAAAEAGKGGGQ